VKLLALHFVKESTSAKYGPNLQSRLDPYFTEVDWAIKVNGIFASCCHMLVKIPPDEQNEVVYSYKNESHVLLYVTCYRCL